MLAFSACAHRRPLLAPQAGRMEIIADAEAPDRPERATRRDLATKPLATPAPADECAWIAAIATGS